MVATGGGLVKDEVAGMKAQMAKLIDAWDPADAKGSVFHTYGSTRINQVPLSASPSHSGTSTV